MNKRFFVVVDGISAGIKGVVSVDARSVVTIRDDGEAPKKALERLNLSWNVKVEDAPKIGQQFEISITDVLQEDAS